MLKRIGVGSVEELFAAIPERYRLTGAMKTPAAMAESEIVEWFKQRAAENATGLASFLGAGAYRHYRPTTIDAMLSRGEWFTAYTPYQAEIAQGTLQAIFELQTMVCELTGQEVANASMYDGATAAAEAMLMAARLTRRGKFVVAKSVHPEYRQTAANYTHDTGLKTVEIGYKADGRVDLSALEAAIDDKTAAVLVQSPNFFGVIENIKELAAAAHAKGALLIVAVAEALSLAIVEPPKEADIVALELQSFGIPLNYGGPYAGVLATKEKNVRQIPGRVVGQTTDSEGRRGFVLTLSTREQHIRREKATSNICTNQGLMALAVNIYLDVYGKQGLVELAKQNLAKAAFAKKLFAEAGAEIVFASANFNEFVVRTKEDAGAMAHRLARQGVVGGLPLKADYPELGEATLWCVTELNTRGQIETAVEEATR